LGGDVRYRGFIGIGGYKKWVSSKNRGYLVKIGFFYWKDVLGGGFNKRILGGIY
jgi:hypothetical protein